MLRKLRDKDDLRGRCSFLQVILLLAMVLFLVLSQGGASVSADRTSIIYEAGNQDSPQYLTNSSEF